MRRANASSIASASHCWSAPLVRAIAPRRYFRVLPTSTRPSLFGSD